MLVKVSKPSNCSQVLEALLERPEIGAEVYVQFDQAIYTRGFDLSA